MTSHHAGGGQKTRVLMELRPCFDGYAGIPQETRLMFAGFLRAADIEAGGLLNGSISVGDRRVGASAADDVARQMRELITLDIGDPGYRLRDRLLQRAVPAPIYRRAATLRGWGRVEALDRGLDPDAFGDWLWMRLFRQALSPDARPLLREARYVTPSQSWGDAARLAMLNPRARSVLDLGRGGWDVYVAHTPSPYRLRGGRMIVRYHDAIPLFWPHTISHAMNHAASHFRMLAANVAEGAHFACTSGPVRDDLLRLFPQLGERAVVIPTMSAGQYAPDPRPRADLLAIIARCRRPAEPPAEVTPVADEPYVMAVSTMEPRKNYGLLLRAVAAARAAGARLRRVVLANAGWGSEDDARLLARMVEEGAAYHLTDVETPDLRALYTGAQAVVCPSRAEGFDLASVEAMACGAPVLASDIPVHRWVCGDAVTYFDPYDESALASLLVDIAALPRDGDRLVGLSAAGLRQAALYGIDRLASAWEELIGRVAAR